MVLHIYNPSHDEALAVNRVPYCPSSAARRTGEMFWDVAKWWKAPDDVILHLPDDGSLRGVEVPDWSGVERIEPWGWDRHIVGVLRKLGAPEHLLPTDSQLDRIRALSSRHTTVKVLERLDSILQRVAEHDRPRPLSILQRVAEHNSPHAVASALPILRAESRWCTDEAAALTAIEEFGGRAVLKLPWSCSGRGVWTTESASSLQRIRKSLREQGAVEVEPWYEKVADFAMEFEADARGRVSYVGLSVFATHDGGGYAGNVVAPQEVLRRDLESRAACPLPLEDVLRRDLESRAACPLPLEAVADCLCEALTDVLAGDYVGPLGVDMILTPAGIHPCIEVNLRNTMGRVAIFQASAQNVLDF